MSCDFFTVAIYGAAKNGLILWATAVVPSLFPFFVATELLSYTNIVTILGKILNPIMRPLFNVPGEAAFPFLMGLISGYPVGAKIVSNFVEQGICNKEEAERMLAFTNNSGPLFIIGTVGITLFKNTTIGILLFISHVLSCICVGIILGIFSRKNSKNIKYSTHAKKNIATENLSISNLGNILGKSIKNGISTVLMIGGFVVLFSVIISILNESKFFDILSNMLLPIFHLLHIPTKFIQGILAGIIELTNGASLIATTPCKELSINIVLCAFLLGLGGLSVLLQVLSIICKNKISPKKYIIGKVLQGLLAAFYTFIALQIFPFLHFNL